MVLFKIILKWFILFFIFETTDIIRFVQYVIYYLKWNRYIFITIHKEILCPIFSFVSNWTKTDISAFRIKNCAVLLQIISTIQINEMKNRLFSIAIFLRILQWTILMCELTTNCFDSLCMYRSAVWQEEVWVSEPGEIRPTVRVNTDQIRGESMLTLNTYQHVPTRANTSKMYQYVPTHTNMYQHVPACKNMYQ